METDKSYPYNTCYSVMLKSHNIVKTKEKFNNILPNSKPKPVNGHPSKL